MQRRSSVINKVRQPLKTIKPTSLNILNIPQWQGYIEKEIGFILPDEQLQWLMNAVDKTARANGLSLKQLWTAVQIDTILRQQLLDTVLIPESRFFRHLPSIQFITKLVTLASELHAQKSPFSIWSVGCSAGQEVWSIAMSLTAQQLHHYTILGTDVSQQALAWARAGQYEYRQRYLIPQYCQQFVQPLETTNNTAESPDFAAENMADWRVDGSLRQGVSFVWHNVFTPEVPTPHLQQLIICQNVLIYFRQFDQRDILARLAAQCAIGGHIILAPGEGRGWCPINMRRINHPQVNGWQKISA